MYWQRYARKGLADHLPPDACEYDRLLAICVDDTFAEFVVQTATSNMKDPEVLGETADDIWDRMDRALRRILHKRQTMTKIQADGHDFTGAALNVIQQALEVFQVCMQPTDIWNPTLLAGLERRLDGVLGAWFRVSLYHPGLQLQSKLPLPFVVLEEHQKAQKPPEVEGLDSVAKVAGYLASVSIDKTLEEVRTMIINREPMTNEQIEFARWFRAYLETGKDINMPRLAHGTLRDRDLTLLECQKSLSSKCPDGCPCVPDREQKVQFRKSNSVDAIEDRNKIRRFFREVVDSPGPRSRDAGSSETP